MTYLVDADWLISYLNGKQQAKNVLLTLANEGISISILSCGEIYEGLARVPDASPQHRAFAELVESVEVLLPDINVARQYGLIRSQLRQQGQLIPDNDMWLAAMAIVHDLTIVSRDRHFTRIQAIRLYADA